jgi:hypothetical protein
MRVGKLGGRRRLWVRVAVSAAVAGLIVAAAYGGFGAVWRAWWSGRQTTTVTLYSVPMLWWGRVGKVLQFFAGLAVVFDLLGPKRLRAMGAHAGKRLDALSVEVKERQAANRLVRLEQWLSDNIVAVVEIPGSMGTSLAVGSASECKSVPADAPFTVAEYQELRAEFLAEHRGRLEDSAAALAQRVRAFMLAHLDPEESQLLVVRGDRMMDAQALLITARPPDADTPMTSARKLMSRFTARVRSDLARAGAEQDTVNVAQVRALAAGMPERYRAAVVVAVGTGLRVSEVAGLAWGA